MSRVVIAVACVLAAAGTAAAGSWPDRIELPDNFRPEGIAAGNGNELFVGSIPTGAVYRLDAGTGDAQEIDVGEPMTNGDGLLLAGRTLYVVQARSNRISVIRLDEDFGGGEVTGTLSHDEFDVPTTVARIGNRLYLPNARFRPPSEPPPSEFWVTMLRR